MNEIINKRIEEVSYEDADGLYPRYFAHYAVRRNGFLAGAEYALENQWISVKEGLPEKGTKVFAQDKYGNCSVSYLNEKNSWRSDDGYEIIVAYWMPIPKLNKDE